jgi:Pyruvate/2-oxoacid:ferredoxin oxidoreductase gamma subunit
MKILIAGIGGQGVITTSKIIGTAAIKEDLTVRTAETIGMAQRGGSVQSHIILDEKTMSPLVPNHEADLILVFEESEEARITNFQKAETKIISISHLDISKLENKKSANIAMLGATTSSLPITEDNIIAAIKETVNSKFAEQNITAFNYGKENYEN